MITAPVIDEATDELELDEAVEWVDVEEEVEDFLRSADCEPAFWEEALVGAFEGIVLLQLRRWW